jgi:hypothetical protein
MAKKPRQKKRQATPTVRKPRVSPFAIGAGIIALVAVAGGILLSPVGNVAGIFSSEDDTRRAVIVDQLSASQPNPAFAESARSILQGDGYIVDYYAGDEVTVELYRNLPSGNYDLVILRTHSTAVVSRGEEEVQTVSLFTNQPYSESDYREEQLEGKIGFAQYSEEGPKWFGVTSGFVKESMKGTFDDALVIGMGCQGLVNDLAAEAFAAKGARAFIGWDSNVSAEHTDKATERVLQLITSERLSPSDAAAKTMRELGPDPHFGGSLVARP